METVVQIAAVCLAAAILGAVLRQHSPETAAVLGLAVCAVVGVLLLRGWRRCWTCWRSWLPPEDCRRGCSRPW